MIVYCSIDEFWFILLRIVLGSVVDVFECREVNYRGVMRGDLRRHIGVSISATEEQMCTQESRVQSERFVLPIFFFFFFHSCVTVCFSFNCFSVKSYIVN